jgi:hypothetical protein
VWRAAPNLAGCGKTPGAVSNPPVPPKASSLFGHNAAALLPHRSSFRRNIRARSGHRGFFRNLFKEDREPPECNMGQHGMMVELADTADLKSMSRSAGNDGRDALKVGELFALVFTTRA